jgi:hypothetical protein
VASSRLQKPAPAGVIYFQKVSVNRVSDVIKKHLIKIRTIYTEGYSPKIVIVTTGWAKEGTDDHAQHRKTHEYIRSANLDILKLYNARILRIKDEDDPQQATRILDSLLNEEVDKDSIDNFSWERPKANTWTKITSFLSGRK